MTKYLLFDDVVFPSAERVRVESRKRVHWEKIKDDDLLKLIPLLERHSSPFVEEAVSEVVRRAGDSFIFPVEPLEKPAPIVDEDVPHWLKVWPFCLFSSHQRAKRRK
jgi:hypothetical protein